MSLFVVFDISIDCILCHSGKIEILSWSVQVRTISDRSNGNARFLLPVQGGILYLSVHEKGSNGSELTSIIPFSFQIAIICVRTVLPSKVLYKSMLISWMTTTTPGSHLRIKGMSVERYDLGFVVVSRLNGLELHLHHPNSLISHWWFKISVDQFFDESLISVKPLTNLRFPFLVFAESMSVG